MVMATTGAVVKPFLSLFTKTSAKRWNFGIRSRLPDHVRNRFKKRDGAQQHGKMAAVNYKTDQQGYWKPGPHKDTILPVQNHPIPIIYPREADEGLWAGEGLIKGFTRKEKRNSSRVPQIWRPTLRKRVIYSEIFDEHMEIVMTDRAGALIDEAYGLDYYILSTPEEDLNSQLAMCLKRDMLLSLIDQSHHPNDPDKHRLIQGRYSKYITMTREEVEWMGLSEEEAIEKQNQIERDQRKPRPLKEIYREELLATLESGETAV